MSDAAKLAGWVVRVFVPERQNGEEHSPSSSTYYNVAIVDIPEATAATRKHTKAAEYAIVEPVRRLTAGEVASIPLRTGDIKPA